MEISERMFQQPVIVSGILTLKHRPGMSGCHNFSFGVHLNIKVKALPK